ncbi:MAG: peptidase C1A papain [Chitinophagaceae bacterium]|nr:peptidase C1A papain [Chitinophagaceae bacterium]MCW5904924.1 peptidase C1A papain [Chitinophagaceae bacterium]
MPIRMVDDNNDNYSNENERTPSSGGNRGGGGNLLQFLPMIIGLLIKKPILLVFVLIGGAIFYFSGGSGCNMNDISNTVQQFATGGNLNRDTFAKAAVYEGLDEEKTNLPEYISLLKYSPSRLNQGQQGSCVAWSSAYAARTILQSVSTGTEPNSTAFSPAFMYNQIGLEGCQGSYIIRAMKNLTEVGAVPFNEFPYDDNDCSRQPNGQLIQEAGENKIIGFTRLTTTENTSEINIHAIKQHLAKDVPVVIGMMVGGSFMQNMKGQEVWHPESDDYNMMGFGGHAMCVIGYDDRKEGGAFQIMNSWGNDWGVNGIGWVLYKDFKHFVREAYGLNPMPKQGSAIAQNLAIDIGLVEANSKQYIPLQFVGNNLFETVNAVPKRTGFKIELKNNTECYVYIIGMETDGSSYVLFPYPSKADANKTMFSPYCSITGYRLFPKGKKLEADDIGNKDFFAIITSKDALDVFQLNNIINQNKHLGFETAVNNAIRRQSVSGVRYNNNANGTIGFKTAVGDKNAVACIIALNKY